MKTLEQFSQKIPKVPMTTVWLLNNLAEYRGKQELFTKQSPQKLKKLKEHALIESAVSSNRIEGIKIDHKRIGTVIFGKNLLHDRDEEEVRGYQDALSWIHNNWKNIKITPTTIKKLHTLTRPKIWDSGKLKQEDGEIIEKHADGRVTIRFIPTPASETPKALSILCDLSRKCLRDQEIPPLIIWAAQNLDFLCIHPFRDGNGRVSRLLLLLSLYHIGFEAGRYISMGKIIEDNKERYYETLQQSSQGWHEGKHNPWPYINYLLYTLKELYIKFEQRIEEVQIPRGEKTEIIRQSVLRFKAPFHINELQKQCPGISIDMIRKVLKDMSDAKEIKCTGRGKTALWLVSGNR